jgi:hypothetical protein
MAALASAARAEAPVPYVPTEDVFTGGPGHMNGLAVELGGGVMNFTGSAARNVSDPGGTWNFRVKLGTKSWFGLEGSYVGSAQSLNEPGLDPNAYLLGNGFESGLRLALPRLRPHWLVSPFLLVGLSWIHYTLQNAGFNSSEVGSDDNVYSVPMAAGVGGFVRNLSYDLRLTYRPTFDDQILGNHDMSSWALSADIGYEF